MGSDEFFKKKREIRKQRKRETRIPKANSYLIITEGKKTEPLYFRGIVDEILRHIGGNVDVCEIPIIDVNGVGRGTNRLIEKADEIVNKAKVLYQNVWVVFDKDDFEDFDDAIQQAEERGYRVAWSNQCFEYWLYLHFNYSDAALHRKEWIKKLEHLFEVNQLGDGTYEKNDVKIYQLLSSNNGIEKAIRNAKRKMKFFNCNDMKPSQFDPGTTVYLLVDELKKYLSD